MLVPYSILSVYLVMRNGGKLMNSNYSSFWFDDNSSVVDDALGVEEPKKKEKNHILLAGYQRAIGNFVRIVGGKDIPVRFASRGDSYTDGKTVTIGANLSEKNFDQTVGLALHEGSHIAFSDFKALERAQYNDWLDGKSHAHREFFKNMINYVEDRRIDNLVFKSSPGYKGYYHTLYSKYFNHKTISMGLASMEYREVDFDSYLFRIINFTNSETDLTALPFLDKIWNLVDLKNIGRLEGTSGAIEVARNICEVIFPLIDARSNRQQEEGNDGGSEEQQGDNQDSQDNQGSGGDVDSDMDMTPQDSDSSQGQPQPLSPKMKKRLDNLVQKEMDLLDGKTPKSRLSKRDQEITDSVAKSGARLEEAGDGQIGKTKVVLIPNFTQELIDSNIFPFTWKKPTGYVSYHHKGKMEVINNGIRLGTLLGKKLKVRGEERELIFTRQRSGKINKRLVSELGFNNANVFSQTRVERYNKANLHLSIDGSSSMSGNKFDKAMTSAVAICKAADMAGNIRVVVSFRYTHKDQPVVLIAYDSSKDKIQKIKNLWSSLSASGTTPESLCFDAMMDNFLQTSNSEDNYFINYSDGAPYFSSQNTYYYGQYAARHCKKMVKNLKNRGVHILSYFISSYDHNRDSNEVGLFKTMYGDDASFINTKNMMEVAKTMNKMFLSK